MTTTQESWNTWIVIPTYEEQDNIERMIHTLFALNVPNLSVLVVDDNSPDGTANLVRTLQKRYPHLELLFREQKRGLGDAYVHGFQYAIKHGATAVVQMDADFSHDPNDIPRLFARLQDADVVLGSRYANGISIVNWPLRRLLLSMGASVYTRLLTGMPFRDATSGFKAWRTETLRAIDLPSLRVNGYGFNIITTYRAWRRNKRIVEVPIIFTERRDGKSKMSIAIMREAFWMVLIRALTRRW